MIICRRSLGYFKVVVFLGSACNKKFKISYFTTVFSKLRLKIQFYNQIDLLPTIKPAQ